MLTIINVIIKATAKKQCFKKNLTKEKNPDIILAQLGCKIEHVSEKKLILSITNPITRLYTDYPTMLSDQQETCVERHHKVHGDQH